MYNFENKGEDESKNGDDTTTRMVMMKMMIMTNLCERIGFHKNLSMQAYLSIHTYKLHHSKKTRKTTGYILLRVEKSLSISQSIFQPKQILLFFVLTFFGDQYRSVCNTVLRRSNLIFLMWDRPVVFLPSH
jgi:hypothetical protein